ncbi:sialate O-acetylesterase [Lutibacter sp. A80]|uniref:sialate O-acetylesterase n=1 Tax=Lutibacter sp. A80 TaxID=2918453 RepID=UPI001F063C45|nr:sialate O-acetylesterase [Lutibacter sp. A80]UMB61737.1 sialate O-acetylesterase [Lutibacter sp. A80]
MRIRLVILVAFGCFCHSIQAQNVKESTVEVVLLAGQSNMAGAGNYDELDEAIRNRVEEVSHRVSLSFNGNVAKPLAFYNNKPSEKYPFLKRFGPELLLGVTLAEKYPSKEFLLIKRSQGGTALYGAWNPFWKEKKAKKIEKGFKQNLQLFNMHIADINKNLEDLKSKGKTYRIIGLAWMQGENDAILKVAAKSYQKNLKKLVKAYRKTFNVLKMPIVIGQINSRYGIDGGANLVRQNMEKFVKQDKYATIIRTSTDTSWSDFPKHTDNVHYNTEGQKRLGIAFAKAFYF